MKKIVTILVIIMILFTMIFSIKNSYASGKDDRVELQLVITNNPNKENIDIYILLPKEYIEFAISSANLNLKYNGPSTLKENVIPGIDVDKLQILDDTYTEDNIEYVQIKLNANMEGIYTFNILSEYSNLDMKYRVKNSTKDYIMHIDNFKIDKGICEIEYNYGEDIVKQPDKKVITFGVKMLIVILILVVMIGLTAYIRGR